ncbi:MAG: hypothetical protein JSR82_12535 [Verrucomicrobia bacterium]|nr:hypothetical protein [Verrucomicrobiota bacterium]
MSHAADVPVRTARLLAVAAAAVPACLLWDFSWESTVGVDLVWAPPHLALYLALACAALIALGTLRRSSPAPAGPGWVLWGALAYLAAHFFDRWWQSLYGLSAGVWHPPQMLKALAFVAVGYGAWRAARADAAASALAGGALLALAAAMLLPSLLANRQRGAEFWQLTAVVFPGVLALLAAGKRGRFGAFRAALCAFGLGLLAVWLLPLIPGSPQVAPVHQPRDHLMPPPFPLLLFLPALAVDLLVRERGSLWLRALEAGLVSFALLVGVQWYFAAFLLSPSADGWLLAGGGRHWPFFLALDEVAKTSFWQLAGDELSPVVVVRCGLLSVLSARLGLALGAPQKGGEA